MKETRMKNPVDGEQSGNVRFLFLPVVFIDEKNCENLALWA